MSDIKTRNSQSRDQAFFTVMQKMKSSLIYEPLAIKYYESGCSCCLSESFTILCKTKDDYKTFYYNAKMYHSKNCAVIRCTCNVSFDWKNITPQIKSVDESFNMCNFSSIEDDNWKYDFEYYISQMEENNSIYKYNDDSDSEDEYFKDKKNHLFYFKKN